MTGFNWKSNSLSAYGDRIVAEKAAGERMTGAEKGRDRVFLELSRPN